MSEGGPRRPARQPQEFNPDTRRTSAAHLPGKGGKRASRQEAALETLQQRSGPLVVLRRHRGAGPMSPGNERKQDLSLRRRGKEAAAVGGASQYSGPGGGARGRPGGGESGGAGQKRV